MGVLSLVLASERFMLQTALTEYINKKEIMTTIQNISLVLSYLLLLGENIQHIDLFGWVRLWSTEKGVLMARSFCP